MTTNTGLNPRLLFAAMMALGSLSTLGCDAQDPAEACLPEDGCDGIADLTEVQPPAPIEKLAIIERADWCAPADTVGFTYVAESPAICEEVEVTCQPGWANIASACGCGCAYVGDAPVETR
jgi:hypothetical protein